MRIYKLAVNNNEKIAKNMDSKVEKAIVNSI